MVDLANIKNLKSQKEIINNPSTGKGGLNQNVSPFPDIIVGILDTDLGSMIQNL